jgi:hypothetical protein
MAHEPGAEGSVNAYLVVPGNTIGRAREKGTSQVTWRLAAVTGDFRYWKKSGRSAELPLRPSLTQIGHVSIQAWKSCPPRRGTLS